MLFSMLLLRRLRQGPAAFAAPAGCRRGPIPLLATGMRGGNGNRNLQPDANRGGSHSLAFSRQGLMVFVVALAAALSHGWLDFIGRDVSGEEPKEDVALMLTSGALLEVENEEGGLPLVSVITPTQSHRQGMHERLYDCFRRQTYPNKEMLVLDTGRPSPFFSALSDERVRYIPQGSARLTTGAKRNRLVAMAGGSFIAHFDDDDYYSPKYLEVMIESILRNRVDMTKLSGFYIYAASDGFFGYWDATRHSIVVAPPPAATYSPSSAAQEPAALSNPRGLQPSILLDRSTGRATSKNMNLPPQDKHILGHGFSYVYSRALFRDVGGFPNIDIEEDWRFVQSAISRGRALHHFRDHQGIALKMFHQGCSSNLLAQFALPAFTLPRIFEDRFIAHYVNPSTAENAHIVGLDQSSND